MLLGEQPSALDLAALFTRLSAPNAAALTTAARAGQLAALLQGVTSQSEFLSAQSDEDYTTALTLAFAVMAQLASAAEATAATTALASLLTADPASRAALKIRTLTNLINVLGNSNTVSASQRFTVLMQMMEFALAAGAATAALVLQPLTSLQAQIRAWKLSPADATALLLVSFKLSLKVGPAGVQSKSLKSKGDDFATPAAAPTFYNLGAQPTLQHEYLYAVLKSLDAAAPATLKEKQYQDLALTAVVASVSNGLAATLHILDPVNVWQLAVVQTMSASNNVQAAAAFQLLRILVDADLPAWVAFEKGAGAALLKENAATLDAATLLRKIRTLALCSLAVSSQSASAGDNLLTYSQIQSKLQLAPKDPEAVEAAVIDAVMAGRIDAMMDQEAETIIVKSVDKGGGKHGRRGERCCAVLG